MLTPVAIVCVTALSGLAGKLTSLMNDHDAPDSVQWKNELQVALL